MGFTDYLVVEWSPSTDPLAAPSWEDITPLVRSVSATRGYGSLLDTFSAGRCTVVVNNGAGADAGFINVNDGAKWKQMRIRSVSAGWYVFSGFVRNTVHGWGQAPNMRTVTFELTDLLGLLASSTVDGVDAYFGGTPLGEVFRASYDNKTGWVTNGGPADVAIWVFSQLNVSLSTDTTAQCHEWLFVPSDLRGPALSLLSNYLEAGLERVEVASDGQCYFRGRWEATINYNANPAAAVFSDDQTVDAGSYRYLRGTLDVAPNDRDFYNTAVVQGVEGDAYTVANVATENPISAYTRTQSPIADANWARGTAQAVMLMSNTANTFPQRIQCVLAGPTATSVDDTHPAFADVLGIVRVVQNDAIEGPYDWTCAVLQVTHTIDAKEGFRVEFNLSDIGFVRLDDQGGGFYQLGVSTLGGGVFFGP